MSEEGWFKPKNSRLWHYFRGVRSLCGKWYFHKNLQEEPLLNAPEGEPCGTCLRKLRNPNEELLEMISGAISRIRKVGERARQMDWKRLKLKMAEFEDYYTWADIQGYCNRAIIEMEKLREFLRRDTTRRDA